MTCLLLARLQCHIYYQSSAVSNILLITVQRISTARARTLLVGDTYNKVDIDTVAQRIDIIEKLIYSILRELSLKKTSQVGTRFLYTLEYAPSQVTEEKVSGVENCPTLFLLLSLF